MPVNEIKAPQNWAYYLVALLFLVSCEKSEVVKPMALTSDTTTVSKDSVVLPSIDSVNYWKEYFDDYQFEIKITHTGKNKVRVVCQTEDWFEYYRKQRIDTFNNNSISYVKSHRSILPIITYSALSRKDSFFITFAIKCGNYSTVIKKKGLYTISPQELRMDVKNNKPIFY